MRFKIRTRLLLWLLVVTLPVFIASLLIVDRVSDRLTETAAGELTNLAAIETQHIRSVVAQTERDGLSLASDVELVALLDTDEDRRSQNSPLTFDQVATRLQEGSAAAGSGILGVRITDRAAQSLGESQGFNASPLWTSGASDAMDERSPQFGLAFVTETRGERIGLAVPIVTDDGSVLGALVLEQALDPFVAALSTYEDFGDTTEANVVQRQANGFAQPISIRRFARDDAFTKGVAPGTPSARSLTVSEPEVAQLRDYRGVETIAVVSRINALDWGLTVKTDRSEALALSNQIVGWIQLASVGTVAILLLSWLTFMNPLGRRLRTTADASERVAQGDYESLIQDASTDEIGDLSRSIDRLATDLKDDIAARQRVEEELRFQANHDELTGLVNRQHASQLIENFQSGELFSLLFIDLDRFKEVNDTYGHAIGDELLVSIARRLRGKLPKSAVLCRWGGDEFVAILAGVDKEESKDIAADLSAALSGELTTTAGSHTIRLSVGGATSSPNRTALEVVAEADAEMFRMKRNRAIVPVVSADVVRNVEEALAQDRIEPFYQPVVRVDAQNVAHLVGVEALARIRQHDGSILTPASFLQPLGAHPLAGRIDERMISKTIADLARWSSEAIVSPDFRVALNAGPAILRADDVTPLLRQDIERAQLDPKRIMIEIPETVEKVDAGTLSALRELGVTIAIDDVGVQFSNLERMVDISADVAKLDRRWIPAMATLEVSKAEVLRALVDQCLTLGLDIIAEGIETIDQLEMLRELGVKQFQGFLFARPMSGEEFRLTWCGPNARMAARASASPADN